MPVQVTLGGDRLGSGNKQKISMHDYGMSSFNLEQDFKSSMAPGVLYPFIKMVGTNHGTFDIDLDTFVRTIPTRGPLFGSFKLQLDLFAVPFRLYQGILHNNPTKIGMQMNQVYLPKLDIRTIEGINAPKVKNSNEYNRQINESALLKYLGLSGLGKLNDIDSENPTGDVRRKINAVPALAYYDIFKCYYSNKQEKNAYVITPGTVSTEDDSPKIISVLNTALTYDKENIYGLEVFPKNINAKLTFTIEGKIKDTADITLKAKTDAYIDIESESLSVLVGSETATVTETEDGNTQIAIKLYDWVSTEETVYTLNITGSTGIPDEVGEIHLEPFALENIDTMRQRLLSSNEMGDEFVIDYTESLYPYKALTSRTTQGVTWNAFAENGLVVKTYQSDLFNNWLDSEWIDGEEGIAALTAVSTSEGAFTIDSFIFAEKLYDIYNRIATGGGTYEDWQEAVYGEGAIRKCETPMYIGGMAAEIMFEEVISNSETKVDNDKQPLGSLAGKGTQVGKRGGQNIHVKCDEPSYIMGIVSITPRISYSQGNDWDLTELETLDDLHKPGLDGIGFQDLIQEQMAWWTTEMESGGGNIERKSAGKQTAWINYQTAVDKCYGDFASLKGYAFMVLNRNYEMQGEFNSEIKDLTTYIDPAKYNYAFAYNDLAAQNFWVQIHSKVVARRKMGAQQIPNL